MPRLDPSRRGGRSRPRRRREQRHSWRTRRSAPTHRARRRGAAEPPHPATARAKASAARRRAVTGRVWPIHGTRRGVTEEASVESDPLAAAKDDGPRWGLGRSFFAGVGLVFVACAGAGLIVWGANYDETGESPRNRIQVYTPSKDAWTNAGRLPIVRAAPTIAPLGDGRTLIVGGAGILEDELTTRTFLWTDATSDLRARWASPRAATARPPSRWAAERSPSWRRRTTPYRLVGLRPRPRLARVHSDGPPLRARDERGGRGGGRERPHPRDGRRGSGRAPPTKPSASMPRTRAAPTESRTGSSVASRARVCPTGASSS